MLILQLSLVLFLELSNTVWAFATAGIRGDTLVELVKFMGDALDEGDGGFFGFQFKRMFYGSTLCVHFVCIQLIFRVSPCALNITLVTLSSPRAQ